MPRLGVGYLKQLQDYCRPSTLVIGSSMHCVEHGIEEAAIRQLVGLFEDERSTKMMFARKLALYGK